MALQSPARQRALRGCLALGEPCLRQGLKGPALLKALSDLKAGPPRPPPKDLSGTNSKQCVWHSRRLCLVYSTHLLVNTTISISITNNSTTSPKRP